MVESLVIPSEKRTGVTSGRRSGDALMIGENTNLRFRIDGEVHRYSTVLAIIPFITC